MRKSIRPLAMRLVKKKDELKKLKGLQAPASIVAAAKEASEVAQVEFDQEAQKMGLAEDQKQALLKENEDYLSAIRYLSDLFPYLPTSRLFKKFLDYGRRWSFEGVAVDLSQEEKQTDLNRMTLDELEAFLEESPDPDQAMHALGIMANHALEWSQSLLVEYRLLANKVRECELDNIPKERILAMLQELLYQIEEDLKY